MTAPLYSVFATSFQNNYIEFFFLLYSFFFNLKSCRSGQKNKSRDYFISKIYGTSCDQRYRDIAVI